MKQKLQDLILLLKQDKRYQVGLAALVFIVGYLVLSESPQRMPRQQAKKDNTVALSQKEAYNDLIQSLKGDIQSNIEQTRNNSAQIAKITESMEQDRRRVAGIFEKMLNRLGEISTNANTVVPSEAIAVSSTEPSAPPEKIETFGETLPVSLVPPAPPAQKKIASIGPGDSVRVKVISGVNAPTDGTPYPVVLKLIDDVRGPDNSALPLGEARIVAAAQGSLTDSRALMRLTQLNLRLPDGRKKVVDVDGWVVGEDGLRGMAGVLIDPFGKAIAGMAQTGFMAGIARGFQAGQARNNSFWGPGGVTDTVTVTGDPAIFALGQGVATSAQGISNVIQNRIQLYVPHVQVYSGRVATAVFSKSVNITDLFEALEDQDQSYTNSVD